jgi:hypothetical protein
MSSLDDAKSTDGMPQHTRYYTAYGGSTHSYLSPRIHRAVATGLTGGRRYVYRVATTGGNTRELSFFTMPQVLASYSDAKVANRTIRVWHEATENGP